MQQQPCSSAQRLCWCTATMRIIKGTVASGDCCAFQAAVAHGGVGQPPQNKPMLPLPPSMLGHAPALLPAPSPQVAAVLKEAGQRVEEDEPILQIETDKVTVDVRAPAAGVVEAILVSPTAACFVVLLGDWVIPLFSAQRQACAHALGNESVWCCMHTGGAAGGARGAGLHTPLRGIST